MTFDWSTLREAAVAAMGHAYAPYSGYAVGAAAALRAYLSDAEEHLLSDLGAAGAVGAVAGRAGRPGRTGAR